MLYYRLRQVDLSGTTTYSPVRAVLLAPGAATPQLLAYPNPAREAVRVLLLGPATTAPLEVYDALGRLVRSQPAPTIGTETVPRWRAYPPACTCCVAARWPSASRWSSRAAARLKKQEADHWSASCFLRLAV